MEAQSFDMMLTNDELCSKCPFIKNVTLAASLFIAQSGGGSLFYRSVDFVLFFELDVDGGENTPWRLFPFSETLTGLACLFLR